MQNIPKSENLDQLVKKLKELNHSACLIIENKNEDNGDKKSVSSLSPKRIGFNFDREKIVSSKIVIQKSKNRAQIKITGNTDAQSFLGYYLGDDENINNMSKKSSQSTLSLCRSQPILYKMKQVNNSPKRNLYKKKYRYASTQASFDDIAITLIDPNHPEKNETDEIKERSTTTDDIEKDFNQNNNNDEEKNQSNNKNAIVESDFKKSNDQTVSKFSKTNKNSLSSKKNDITINPNEKDSMLLYNENKKTEKNSPVNKKKIIMNENYELKDKKEEEKPKEQHKDDYDQIAAISSKENCVKIDDDNEKR